MKPQSTKQSDRLIIIESFLNDPPESDFQRGYLCALMDEAVQDIDEAGSDIFEQAFKLFPADSANVFSWKRQRAKTLA